MQPRAAACTRWARACSIALDAIRANKVRAGLTILGIAVGVFVVAAMAAARARHQRGRREVARGRGPDHVLRHALADGRRTTATAPPTAARGGTIRRSRSTRRRASRSCRRSTAVIAHIGVDAQVKYHDRDLAAVSIDALHRRLDETSTAATSRRAAASPRRERERRAGRHHQRRAWQEALFGESIALGKTITVDGQPFTVIGVYQPTGELLQQRRQAGARSCRSRRRVAS